MTKRNKITIVLSTVLSGLILVSGLAAMTDGFKDFNPDHFFTNAQEEQLAIEEVNNIRFTQVKEKTLSDGTIQKQVKFTLEPSDAKCEDLNAAIKWNTEFSEEFESENWYDGKNILEYVDYQLDDVKQQLTFNCYQPFGTEIIFSLSSKDDPNVNASLKINYNRREIKKATATLQSDGFTPGQSMRVETALPVFSIGSKGERAPTSEFTLKTEYISKTNYTFDDLFAGVSTVGIYSSSFKYQGNTYEDKNLLLSTMKSKVKEYLTDLPSLTSDNIFEAQTFKDLLTYEYAAHYTYQIVYAESTINYASFISSYHEGYEQGAGYQVTVKLDDETVMSKLLPLNLSINTITNINLENSEIEF